MNTLDRTEVHNLAAGPSPLPTKVLEKAAVGLLNYNGTGMGVCELSHRGKEFKGIIEGAERDLRQLLQVPESHAILFTQGGGTQQFSSVVLNLLAYHRLQAKDTPLDSYTPPTLDYIVTGSWSSKASAEAKRLVVPSTPDAKPLANINIAASTKSTGFTRLPRKEEYNFTPGAGYVYYCENETINGVQFPGLPDEDLALPFDLIPENVPLIADYSSSFISRPIPHIDRHALIYAGAQKNLGPAGVVVIIIRKDLLVDTSAATLLGGVPACPIELEYKILADNASLYNTPPVFSIYVSALVLTYLIEEKGGIAGVTETNKAKAKLLYDTLEAAERKGLVRMTVKDRGARSWMNVTFVIVEKDGEEGNEREKRFLKGAEEKGFRQIKGHRSVGGIRASLYNAVTPETVKALCQYINDWVAKEKWH